MNLIFRRDTVQFIGVPSSQISRFGSSSADPPAVSRTLSTLSRKWSATRTRLADSGAARQWYGDCAVCRLDGEELDDVELEVAERRDQPVWVLQDEFAGVGVPLGANCQLEVTNCVAFRKPVWY
jgi:hypothetical protein